MPNSNIRLDFQGALNKLIANLGTAHTTSGVPGISIAVVHRDGVVTDKLSIGNRKGSVGDVTPDTVFQLASVSKPITTTIVARLLSQSRSGLDWKRAIPKGLLHPDRPGVSLGSLFAHRSGLPGHVGDYLEDVGYDEVEILRRLPLVPLARTFGVTQDGNYDAGFAYTNFGVTLGAFIAALDGAPDPVKIRSSKTLWQQLAADLLFTPLKMGSTSSRVDDFRTHLRNGEAAWPHVRVPRPAPGKAPFPDAVWSPAPESEIRNPDAQTPAGGVSSTVRDLAQWMQLQLGLIEFDAGFRTKLDETHQPWVPGAGEGLGWNVGSDGVRRLSHSGAFCLGAGTHVALYPDHQIGIVVLTNGQPVGVPEALAAAFMLDLFPDVQFKLPRMKFPDLLDASSKIMQAAAFAINDPAPARSPGDEKPWSEYEGRYDHPFYGPITVSDDKTSLFMSMAGTTMPLEYLGGDTFQYTPPGENGGLPSLVSSFLSTSLRVQQLADPYSAMGVENLKPDDVANYVTGTATGVYYLDKNAEIRVNGVLRSLSFYANNTNRVALVIYTPSGSGYVVRQVFAEWTPTAGEVNRFYTGDFDVQAGEVAGFYEPDAGPIAFAPDPNGDRNDLNGQILWSAEAQPRLPNGTSIQFVHSSNRSYLFQVEVVHGVRGGAVAKRA
jgi:CubicO group peptidase (beta-lactamase class C family)